MSLHLFSCPHGQRKEFRSPIEQKTKAASLVMELDLVHLATRRRYLSPDLERASADDWLAAADDVLSNSRGCMRVLTPNRARESATNTAISKENAAPESRPLSRDYSKASCFHSPSLEVFRCENKRWCLPPTILRFVWRTDFVHIGSH